MTRMPADSAIISVDHTEFEPDTTYRGVDVRYGTAEARFATGDPVADFRAGLAWGVTQAGHVLYSSTVDNFVMDGTLYEYDDDGMLRMTDHTNSPERAVEHELVTFAAEAQVRRERLQALQYALIVAQRHAPLDTRDAIRARIDQAGAGIDACTRTIALAEAATRVSASLGLPGAQTPEMDGDSASPDGPDA